MLGKVSSKYFLNESIGLYLAAFFAYLTFGAPASALLITNSIKPDFIFN